MGLGEKPPGQGSHGVSFSPQHIEQSPEVCTHLQPDMDTRFTQRCSPLGRLNVKNEEIDEMIKEAPGPINFTVFLTMFGEKLKGERAPGELGGASVGTHTITNILSHLGKPPNSRGLHHPSR